jgi:hypothetical protein
MSVLKPLPLLGALGLTLAGAAPQAAAQPICCYNCGPNGPARTVALPGRAQPSRALEQFMAIQQRHSRTVSPAVLLSDPSIFVGEINGTWEDIDGYFTIPYTLPVLGQMNILLRGFPTQPLGGNRYAVTGWDRSVYWLDVGDGTPRLLQALELATDYVPAEEDYFYDTPEVRTTCVIGAGCTLNLVPYLRYQEFGANYSNRGHNENGVRFDQIQMAFVTDDNGDAIDAAVLFDDAAPTTPIQPFQQGDTILLSTLAYKIDEPEYIYALGYMDVFEPLQPSANITRANYVPGVDFVDPDLPANLDAGNRPVRLILDASNGDGGGYGTGGTRTAEFAYGGPFDLGFLWKDAQAFVFRDGLETLVPANRGAAKSAPRWSWVRETHR